MKIVSSLLLVISLSLGTAFGGQLEMADCSEMKPACCCPADAGKAASCPVQSQSDDCDCSLSDQQSTLPSALTLERTQEFLIVFFPTRHSSTSLVLAKLLTHDFEPPPATIESYRPLHLRAPPQHLPYAA